MHFLLDEEGWLAICFVVFVVLSYRPIKNAILSFLDNKIDLIKKEASESHRLKLEAEEELKILQEEFEILEKKHAEALSKAKQEMSQNLKERCQEFDHNMEYRKNAAFQSLEQLKIDSTRKIEQGFLEIVLRVISDYTSSKQSGNLDCSIFDNAVKNH
jgi:F-type H+-transporting ATPase subunit b